MNTVKVVAFSSFAGAVFLAFISEAWGYGVPKTNLVDVYIAGELSGYG